MHGIMAEDENFNTSCIGRVIHTPTTPGLITRTYTLLTHWQTSCLQTPLWLDDLQYKETTEIPQTILIPTSIWLSNTLQKLLQSTARFVSTTQTCFLPFTLLTTALPSQQCPAPLPPFSFLPTPCPLSIAVATPLTLLPLLLRTVLPVTRWLFPISK